MRKARNNGVSYFLPKSWGLMAVMVLAAGVSIYAVADSRPQQPGATELAKPAPVTAEDVAAFDPFHPQKAADIAESDQIDLSNALADSVVTPSSYDIPAPLALPAPEASGEPTDATVEEGEEVQLAAAPPAREGRLGSTRNGSSPTQPKKGGGPANGSGNYSWVLPTALIGAGAIGVTLGTIAIVRHNDHDDSKKVILSP